MPNPAAYERDPRLTRLETTVVDSGEADGRPFVVLADTVLYPEGGGQPADRGTISGVAVLDVQKVDGVIRHWLAAPIDAGSVTVELEWARRFDHMQQHTAQHLITAIAADRFGWGTTSFHLGEYVSDVELDVADLSDDRLEALEEAVAAEVRAARPVSARRVTTEEYARLTVRSRGLPEGHVGDIRLVEIEGIDLNTCGGTHCASTAELETVKLLGTEAVRGGTRVFYLAGARLRDRLATEVARTRELRALLGAADEEIAASVQARLEQLKEATKAQRQLEEDYASAFAESLATRDGSVVVAHLAGRGLPFLQRVARTVGELAPDRAVFLTAGEGDEGVFLLSAGEGSSLDVSMVGPRVAEILGGAGGGRGGIFQGRATTLSRRDEVAALLG